MSEELRILIVDDEKRILETFSLLLSDLGYYVKTASTPEAAIELVKSDNFHIAFVDQFLGPIKGMELIKKLAPLNPELAYVIITANANADLAVEALKDGASDFITKPFFTADMIKSIDYVSRKKDLERQRREMLRDLEEKVDEKTEEIRQVYFSVLATLAQAMEKKDMGTYGHSRRVSQIATMIAEKMGLSEQEQQDLSAASLLHDIGKIGISDFVLGKNGPLDDSEFHHVKSHPQKGVEILRPLKQFQRVLPAIKHHHEYYDGSGYPDGLKGSEIPLLARIITVADTYDAIISNRPYRSAQSHEAALMELKRFAGVQFDPEVVEILLGLSVHQSEVYQESGA